MSICSLHGLVYLRSKLDCITFMEIDHEIIAMVVLPLPLIQEGQLSVIWECMCTHTGRRLRRQSLTRKSVSRLTDWLGMTGPVKLKSNFSHTMAQS